MDDFAILLLILFGILMAVMWLGLVLYGLHRYARILGRQFPSYRHPWIPYLGFGLVSSLASCVMMLVPVDRLTRFCFGAMIWILVFHPLAMGYWFTRRQEKEQDYQKWWKRAHDWLSEWESRNRDHH